MKHDLSAIVRSLRLVSATRIQLVLTTMFAAGVLAFRFGMPELLDTGNGSSWRISPLSDQHLARDWVRHYGYWAILATVALFVLALVRELRARWPGWAALKPHWPGLLVAVLGALFWQANEPRTFKVLFDEHVLAGTAYNMHYEREASFPSSGHFLRHQIVTLLPSVDKRPLLFPFLVSLAHDLTGYRPENSFYVNGLAALALLLFIYGAGAALGGWRIGCLGQLLLIGLPLMAQSSTGGGFDLLNAAVLAGFVLAAWNYWRQPAAGGLDVFVFAGLLLANARYESLLYLGAVAVIYALKCVRERSLSCTWLAAFSPLLALLPLLVNQVFVDFEGNFQTTREDFLNPGHLLGNIEAAMYYLFSFDLEPEMQMTNSALLSAAGVVSLVALGVLTLLRGARWWRERRFELPLVVILAVVLANVVIAFNLSWGKWTDPIVGRFSMPLQMAFALAVMAVAAEICTGRRLSGWVLAVVGAWSVIASAPVSARATSTHGQETMLIFNWARDYLNRNADKGVLVIARSTLMLLLDGHPCMVLGSLSRSDNPEKVIELRDYGLYREVWVLQEYHLNRRLNAWVESPKPDTRIDQRFILETVAEYPVDLERRARISRIVGWDPSRTPGTVLLRGEVEEMTDTSSVKTENILTERPEGQPPAVQFLPEVPPLEELRNQLQHRMF